MNTTGFQRALADALELRGMSEAQAARMSGVGTSTINSWVRGGARDPRPAQVMAVERALGLKDGELSAHLGWVPVEALRTEGDPLTFGQWLALESSQGNLDPREAEALHAVYRCFMGPDYDAATASDDLAAAADEEISAGLARAEARDRPQQPQRRRSARQRAS